VQADDLATSKTRVNGQLEESPEPMTITTLDEFCDGLRPVTPMARRSCNVT
jgi:hypothetical protein